AVICGEQCQHRGVENAILDRRREIGPSLDHPAIDPGGYRLGRLQMRDYLFEQVRTLVNVLFGVAEEYGDGRLRAALQSEQESAKFDNDHALHPSRALRCVL